MDKKAGYSLKARILFAIYAVLCLLIFSCALFPYHVVKPGIERGVGRALRSDVSIGTVTGRFPFGLKLEDLRVGGETLAPSLTLRPALSGSLLGRLGLVITVNQARGSLEGIVRTSFKHPGDPLALKFTLEEFDIAPLKTLMRGGPEIAGMVTGKGRLASQRANFKDSQGEIDIACRNGQLPLNIPGMPLGAVSFTDLTFKAAMEKGRLEIRQMQISGNDVSGTLSGDVRLGMNVMTSELNISGNLKLSQLYRQMLGNPPGDSMRFRLQGTLGRPRFMPQ